MKKVLVGLSGGVDSALTAALLQRDGYEVTGLYCIMHDVDKTGLADAEKVAKHLGISLLTADLRARFEEIVVTDFLENYAHAKTPNPCIVCNPAVKFKALCDEADRLGIEKIATGHYAAIVKNNDGRFAVQSVGDKDQSYMLYRLPQEQLKRILFPLSHTKKEENRKTAEKMALPVFQKPDSQDICFIKGQSYVDFIEARLGNFPEGDFWSADENKAVGRHKGLIRYTVGQRKNLGIALGAPVYVTKLDSENNRVILSKTDVINAFEITANSLVYQGVSPDAESFEAFGKLRFSAKFAPCKVTIAGGRLTAIFETPQRAATPGQSAVFYDKNGTILCGGFLE